MQDLPHEKHISATPVRFRSIKQALEVEDQVTHLPEGANDTFSAEKQARVEFQEAVDHVIDESAEELPIADFIRDN